MKCHYHYGKDASAQCIDCKKGLCPECTNRFTIPICESCMSSRNSRNKIDLIKNLIIMSVLFIGSFILNRNNDNIASRTIMSLMFAGVPWGWSFLSKITPNIFIFMPIMGWVIYLFVKLLLSLVIGLFVAPYKIYKIISGLKQVNKLESSINR